MGFVTCRNIGDALIQWIINNEDRHEDLCNAWPCDVGGPQTQVSPTSETVRGQNTYVVDHKGTWPNEVIRTAYVVRNGDAANINIWNPADNDWDVVSIYAPEDILILNNPVFYIRQATGSANPPINSQSDLTVANAFDSWTSLYTFINRTNIFGFVTVDVRGTFSAADFPTITPARYKNAQDIRVRGDAANPEAFRIVLGEAGSIVNGFVASEGAKVRVQDWNVHLVNQAEHPTASPLRWVTATGGATVELQGIMRITGAYSVNRAGALGMTGFYANGGTIEFFDATTVQYNQNGNTVIFQLYTAARGGVIAYRSANHQFNSNLNCTQAIFTIASGSRISFSGGPAPTYENPPTFTGSGEVTSPSLMNMTMASIQEHINYSGGWGIFADWLAANFPHNVTNPIYNIDINSYFSNRYGSQWTGDPRFA